MHELSLATNILAIVEQTAAEENLASVSVVRLRIGKLRQVVPEAMRMAFDAAKEGTVARDASLEMHFVSIRLRCQICGRVRVVEDRCYFCPLCAGTRMATVTGDELLIETLEGER